MYTEHCGLGLLLSPTEGKRLSWEMPVTDQGQGLAVLKAVTEATRTLQKNRSFILTCWC